MGEPTAQPSLAKVSGERKPVQPAGPNDRIQRENVPGNTHMAKFLLWVILLILCWPLALLALVAYPVVWLLLLPFRIVGIAVEGILHFLRSLFLLPARVLGGPGR